MLRLSTLLRKSRSPRRFRNFVHGNSIAKRVETIIQRIRRMCLHSDNLGFPEMCCCTLCHNVDSYCMNNVSWRITHSYADLGLNPRLRSSIPANKIVNAMRPAIVAKPISRCVSCYLHMNTTLPALKAPMIELRPAVIALSMIRRWDDHAPHRSIHRNENTVAAMPQTAANLSPNSVALTHSFGYCHRWWTLCFVQSRGRHVKYQCGNSNSTLQQLAHICCVVPPSASSQNNKYFRTCPLPKHFKRWYPTNLNPTKDAPTQNTRSHHFVFAAAFPMQMNIWVTAARCVVELTRISHETLPQWIVTNNVANTLLVGIMCIDLTR